MVFIDNLCISDNLGNLLRLEESLHIQVLATQSDCHIHDCTIDSIVLVIINNVSKLSLF